MFSLSLELPRQKVSKNHLPLCPCWVWVKTFKVLVMTVHPLEFMGKTLVKKNHPQPSAPQAEPGPVCCWWGSSKDPPVQVETATTKCIPIFNIHIQIDNLV